MANLIVDNVPDVKAGGYMNVKIPDIPKELTVLGDTEPDRSGNVGVFRIMTPQDGDKRVIWDHLSLKSIRDAKKLFGKLLKQGFVPYLVGTNGKASSEVMDKFDPYAEEVIFLPVQAVAGG